MQQTNSFTGLEGISSGVAQTPAAPYRLGHKDRYLPVKDTLWTLPGFCANTKVGTSFGELPVHALRLRDPLRTVAGTNATVGWVDKVHLDEEFLRTHPDAQPIMIRAGSLGQNLPKEDLIVSPHQKINMSKVQFRQEFCLARDLEHVPGVMRKPEMMLTYFLFHCTVPVTVSVNGTWTSVVP